VLQRDHVTLVPKTRRQALAYIDSLAPDERVQVSADWLARVRAGPETDPWTFGFTIVDRVTSVPVGVCGFKGPAGQDGTVEIAYGIDAEYRGRGYATAAAMAMVEYAFAHQHVGTVRAHTFSDGNASARVLLKCGFHLIGQVEEPDDGLVWRWEKTRRDAAARQDF
jgi:[ribosomal protein S5]-alanine N-acetyltransferase